MTDLVPKWLEIARAEIGIRETPGTIATPRILEYLATTPLKDGGKTDETPWCSSFVNWCLKQCGIQGTRSAAARSWLTWGEARDHRPGAIVVIHHRSGGTSITSSGFHVAFSLGGDAHGIRLLGGNQGDAVSEIIFPLDRWDIVACRWPLDGNIVKASVKKTCEACNGTGRVPAVTVREDAA